MQENHSEIIDYPIDINKFPNAKNYKFIEIELKKNECLLIPSLWVHWVFTDPYSYALSFKLINCYKKEDPYEQSIWSTDTTRYTFIIKDIVEQNEKWIRDSKGGKITKYIVEPVLKKISELCGKYIEETEKKIYPTVPTYSISKTMEKRALMNDSNDMKDLLLKSKFTKSIINNICTEFKINYSVF